MHTEHIDAATKRHRRTFAVLRIAEVTFGVLGGLTALLVFTAPASPGNTTRELHFIAWSTPRIFLATTGVLLGAAAVLHVASRPLKRRWANHLRGWIT